jgi:guanosine-3',5'-bis(diphosphate) 3'-pyrophosphohydrolase
MWAKQVTDGESRDRGQDLMPVCAPANPELSQRLTTLFKTAYTHVDGQYFPCHPEMCGPLTEEEKGRVDSRFATCKSGEKPCPRTLFF